MSNTDTIIYLIILLVLFLFSGSTTCQAANDTNTLANAIKKGDLAKVQLLVEGGADVNATKSYALVSDVSMLAIACNKGQYEVAKYLIESGADVNNGTPVYWAALSNHPEIVKLLIEKGANVNKSCGSLYPLMGAIKNTESVRILLEAGANPNLEDCFGHTALWFANVNGKTEAAQLIRQYGGIVTNP